MRVREDRGRANLFPQPLSTQLLPQCISNHIPFYSSILSPVRGAIHRAHGIANCVANTVPHYFADPEPNCLPNTKPDTKPDSKPNWFPHWFPHWLPIRKPIRESQLQPNCFPNGLPYCFANCQSINNSNPVSTLNLPNNASAEPLTI